MRTLLLLLLATAANAQTTTTVYDLNAGRIVSQQTRDTGMIYIERGNRAVLQTFPADYYYGYRSHRCYGRAYRGYAR
jgi:predicted lipase